MKIIEILLVSIVFRTNLLIFSLASAGSAHRTRDKSIFRKFSTLFSKIFAKISIKFSKNYKFFIDFLTMFWKFSILKKREILDFYNEKLPTPPAQAGPLLREPPQTQNPVKTTGMCSYRKPAFRKKT